MESAAFAAVRVKCRTRRKRRFADLPFRVCFRDVAAFVGARTRGGVDVLPQLRLLALREAGAAERLPMVRRPLSAFPHAVKP
jgi:hypothetical protein